MKQGGGLFPSLSKFALECKAVKAQHTSICYESTTGAPAARLQFLKPDPTPLIVGCFHTFFFYPEDGSDTFLQHVAL
jgi:hypothetical protein